MVKPEIAKTTEPKQSPKHEDPLRIPESGFIRGGEDPLIIESLDPTGVQDSASLIIDAKQTNIAKSAST